MASVSAPGFGVTGGSRRDVLSQALQGVRSQIKRLRKQAAKSKRSSKNTGVMTHHQQRVAAAVYVLSRHDVKLAGEKVLTYPCSKAFGTTQQQAERMVEDVFMSLPDGFSSSLDDPVDAATSRIVQEAKNSSLSLELMIGLKARICSKGWLRVPRRQGGNMRACFVRMVCQLLRFMAGVHGGGLSDGPSVGEQNVAS